MKTTIDYISAIPGLGKTYWAIGELVKNLRAGICSIYVAPTTKLVDQVYDDLRTRLTSKEFMKVSRFHHETCDNVHRRVLNEVKTKKLKLGTTILTTHETFLKLPLCPEFKKFALYFDEARKIVTQSKQVKLEDLRAQKLFRQLFTLELRSEGSSFRQVKKADGDSSSRLRKNRAFRESPQLIKQYKEIERLLEIADNPRYEVYLNFPSAADAHEEDGSRYLMTTHKFFEIIVPSNIFEGFRKVTVLAAHFEDSQMYHLLKENPQVRLRNITRTALSESFKRRFAALRQRYGAVTIVPLTPQWKALSTHQLNSQLLAPETEVEEILENIGSVGKIREQIKDLLVSSKNRLSKVTQRKVDYLNSRGDVEFDPLMWYLRSARKVVAAWRKQAPVHGLPLIMINKRYAKPGSTYMQLLCDHGRPLFEVLPFMNHGLNCYDDRNVLVFLAAINPTTAMINFYRERLPSYDFSKDHVADVAVQSVCRLSLRDADSKEKVLVVVPDQNIATLLEDKMFNRANRSMRWTHVSGSMTMVTRDPRNRFPPDYFEATQVKERRNDRDRKNREGCPLQRRQTSIRNLLSRWRKKLGEHPRAEQMVDRYTTERKAIQELYRKHPNMDKQKILDKAKMLAECK